MATRPTEAQRWPIKQEKRRQAVEDLARGDLHLIQETKEVITIALGMLHRREHPDVIHDYLKKNTRGPIEALRCDLTTIAFEMYQAQFGAPAPEEPK